MSINWEMVSASSPVIAALAAVIAALAAVVGLWWQSKLTRFSVNLDNMMRLDAEGWNSDHMRKIRRKVAENYLNTKHIDDNIGEVLDFFQGLGLYLRRGALDTEMVWSNFEYWAIKYW